MSGLIIPGGNGANPALEVAKAPIGGMDTEYFVKPGVGPQINITPGQEMLALDAAAKTACQAMLMINALVRECVALREKIEEVEKERLKDKTQIDVLLAKAAIADAARAVTK